MRIYETIFDTFAHCVKLSAGAGRTIRTSRFLFIWQIFFSFSKWRMALRSCGLNCQLPSCRLLPTGKAITARFLRTFFLLGGLPTPPFFRSESSLTSIRDIQRNMCAKEANKVENWDRKKNYTCATLSTNISNKDSAKLYFVLLGGVLYEMRFLYCKISWTIKKYRWDKIVEFCWIPNENVEEIGWALSIEKWFCKWNQLTASRGFERISCYTSSHWFPLRLYKTAKLREK